MRRSASSKKLQVGEVMKATLTIGKGVRCKDYRNIDKAEMHTKEPAVDIIRKRCCCNCGHCIRVRSVDGSVTHNQCELDRHYIGYIETFEGWCRRWKHESNTND